MGAATPSSRHATPSGAPGISSATRASARTRTCTRSAIRSGPGTARSRSPTATPSSSTSRTRRRTPGVDAHIRFHHRVTAADWSTRESRWHITAERTDTGETLHLTAGFLFSCSGYYRYDHGYQPDFEGMADFAGTSCIRRRGRKTSTSASKRDRRHRQRRHRRDPRSRAGAVGRARHHAAALADLHRLAAREAAPSPRWLRKVLPAQQAGTAAKWFHAVADPGLLPVSRQYPALVRRMLRKGLERSAPARATTSTPTSRPATTRGTSGSAPCPNGDLFKSISRRHRVGGHRPHRALHRAGPPARARAQSSRRTSS